MSLECWLESEKINHILKLKMGELLSRGDSYLTHSIKRKRRTQKGDVFVVERVNLWKCGYTRQNQKHLLELQHRKIDRQTDRQKVRHICSFKETKSKNSFPRKFFLFPFLRTKETHEGVRGCNFGAYL
jgi:hypothetical protein